MSKLNERLIWVCVIVFGAFMIQNQSNTNANLETILKTYHLESEIQNSEITDFNNQLHVVRDNSYLRGFEAGKTQAGIALAQGESLYDYKEGYHAALTQQVDEAMVLEVSEGIMFELTSLRKMVPRLLKQNEDLQVRLDAESDYVWSLFLEGLDSEIEADEVYLDIIDMLMEPNFSPPSSLPSVKELVQQEE